MLKSHTGNAEEETPYYEPLIEGFRNRRPRGVADHVLQAG
jgi:hypothetical protein